MYPDLQLGRRQHCLRFQESGSLCKECDSKRRSQRSLQSFGQRKPIQTAYHSLRQPDGYSQHPAGEHGRGEPLRRRVRRPCTLGFVVCRGGLCLGKQRSGYPLEFTKNRRSVLRTEFYTIFAPTFSKKIIVELCQ